MRTTTKESRQPEESAATCGQPQAIPAAAQTRSPATKSGPAWTAKDGETRDREDGQGSHEDEGADSSSRVVV